MQRLDLNLASNPFRNNTLLWVGYGSAAIVLVLFSIWNVNTFVDYRARLLELRDTVGTFRSQRLELEARGRRALEGIRGFDVESLQIKTDKANEVIAWKAFSWTRLFNTLEQVLPYQVRMNSVRPIFNPTGGRQQQGETQAGAMPVAIEGTARSFDDLAELQRAFHADAQIGRVEPQRLDKTDNGEFAFQLRFMYAPVERVRDAGEAAEEDAAAGEEVAEVPSGEPGAGNDGEPSAEAEQANLADPEAAPLELIDPEASSQKEISREAVGAPAAKARRDGRPRSRPDERRRRPGGRDQEAKDPEEDQP
jgi:hypothetical protein